MKRNQRKFAILFTLLLTQAIVFSVSNIFATDNFQPGATSAQRVKNGPDYIITKVEAKSVNPSGSPGLLKARAWMKNRGIKNVPGVDICFWVQNNNKIIDDKICGASGQWYVLGKVSFKKTIHVTAIADGYKEAKETNEKNNSLNLTIRPMQRQGVVTR